MERVFASMSTHNASSHQCFEGAPNQNFAANIVYDVTTEQCQKSLFLASFHYQAFQSLGTIQPYSVLTHCHAIKLLCFNLISFAY